MAAGAPTEDPLGRDNIGRLSLFENADPDQIRDIISDCQVAAVEEGDLVLRPEHRGGTVFVILKGRFTVHLGSPEGTAIAMLGPGECAGELSFVDRKRVSAYVRAASSCTILRIDEETMWRLVNESHQVAVNLLHMLARRVRHDNAIITSTAKEGERLQREATVDALTGCFNRRWMDEMFGRALEQCAAEGRPAALMMLDIDRFKGINDGRGHHVGDMVLKAIANVLSNGLRPDDMLARFGGEEFSILLPSVTARRAMQVAERLRHEVSELEIEDGGGEPVGPITISIGVCACEPGTTLMLGLESADRALYRAKETGRDRVVLAD